MIPQTISEKCENNEIGSTKLTKHQLCQQRRQIRIEKMRSKNKRKSNSSFNNVSTSCAILNNHVDNNIDFNLVEPNEGKKGMLQYLFIISQNNMEVY